MAIREEELTSDSEDEGDADVALRREAGEADEPDPDVVPDCTCEGGIVRL